MYSSDVTTERATLQQYNRLRADAKGASWLLPHQRIAGANMTIEVEPGRWVKNDPTATIVNVAARLTSSTLVAPSVNLVSINGSGALVVTGGGEAASPTAPSLPAGNLAIATIYHRVGETSIKDADDATNGYITDIRPLLFQPIPDVLYTTSVQTLSGNVSLGTSDGAFQYLNPNGTDRTITIATASMVDGRPFNIVNTGTSGNLIVKYGSTEITRLRPGQSALFTFDGTNTVWRMTLFDEYPVLNIESLSGNKSLALGDKDMQILNPNGSNRDVTLGTSNMPDGRQFWVSNSGSAQNLTVKQSSTVLATVVPGTAVLFSYDLASTTWYALTPNRYGLVNPETLSGNKTLDSTSDQIQYLNANGTNRNVTLDTTAIIEGASFYIKNESTSGNLTIKQSSTTLLVLYPGQSCIAQFDGTNWKVMLHFVDDRFGDGRDGILDVTSGTTQIDCTGHVGGILVKQYVSFNVSSGATIEFINVPAGGIVFMVMTQGAYVMAGTVDMDGDGATGGSQVSINTTGSTQSGNSGTATNNALGVEKSGGAGSGDSDGDGSSGRHNAASGGGGAASSFVSGSSSSTATTTNQPACSAGGGSGGTAVTAALVAYAVGFRGIVITPGGGGASGGVSASANNVSSGTLIATAGAAGRGAGSMMVICGGDFTSTGTYLFRGTAASSSSVSSTVSHSGANWGRAAAAGGSSGGAGGTFLGFVKRGQAITNSATYTLTAGSSSNGDQLSSGTGGGASSDSAVSNGGASANGISQVMFIL